MRHNDVEYICPKFSNDVQEKKTKILNPEPVEEEIKDEKNYSSFGSFIDNLSRMGCNVEVILRKHNETQEEFDETTLTDLDAEHEKENE